MKPFHSALPALAVAGAAVFWGLWWLPLRWVGAARLPGDWSSLAIYGVATLVVLPLAWRRRRRLLAGGTALLMVGLGFGAVLSLWNHALLVGEVVRVVLLFYLAPVWATGFAWLVLGERPGLLRLVTIVMGLAGAAVVLGFEGGVPLPRSQGDWVGLGSGVLFALTMTLHRRAEGIESLDTTVVSFFGATLVAAGLVLFLADRAPPPGLTGALVPVAAIVVLWLVPQTWLVLWGAARLDPGRVSILLLLEVATAVASAAILTAEPFGPREALGCALILGAGLLEGLSATRHPGAGAP